VPVIKLILLLRARGAPLVNRAPRRITRAGSIFWGVVLAATPPFHYVPMDQHKKNYEEAP
jgi:hypothetical protein